MNTITDLNSMMVLMFVACRVLGVIVFNPIFGRQVVPGIVKVGLSLGLSLSISEAGNSFVLNYSGIDMLTVMIKELAVGLILGFIMTLFFSVFHFGGQLVDYQMGLAMATMYDPMTNSQVSISGNMMTVFYSLLFFVTNSHINMIAVTARSYNVAPLGYEAINGEVSVYILELFAYILIYAVQLALPWIVTVMVVEVAVGIMMKVVPNINVFVVNIQLKVVCGLVIMITVIPVLVKFMTQVNTLMMQRFDEVIMKING